MGRRANRGRPTRKEEVGRKEGERVRRSEGEKTRRSEDQRERRRREMSPETRELAETLARVMGWAPERVLPNADNVEVSHHV